MTSREFVGAVVFLGVSFTLGLALFQRTRPSPSAPLPPLAQGPGTSECWAEIVHAGILCHKALGCADAKTKEEALSPVIPECDVPCADIAHALDSHYGVSR